MSSSPSMVGTLAEPAPGVPKLQALVDHLLGEEKAKLAT
jgi:hypothetical protein